MDSTFDESMLTAYLDNELSPEERDTVESELNRSPDLRQLLIELQQVRSLVKQLHAQKPLKSYDQAPWRTVENDANVSVPITTVSKSKLPVSNGSGFRRVQWIAAIAASMIIVVSLVFLSDSNPARRKLGYAPGRSESKESAVVASPNNLIDDAPKPASAAPSDKMGEDKLFAPRSSSSSEFGVEQFGKPSSMRSSGASDIPTLKTEQSSETAIPMSIPSRDSTSRYGGVRSFQTPAPAPSTSPPTAGGMAGPSNSLGAPTFSEGNGIANQSMANSARDTFFGFIADQVHSNADTMVLQEVQLQSANEPTPTPQSNTSQVELDRFVQVATNEVPSDDYLVFEYQAPAVDKLAENENLARKKSDNDRSGTAQSSQVENNATLLYFVESPTVQNSQNTIVADVANQQNNTVKSHAVIEFRVPRKDWQSGATQLQRIGIPIPDPSISPEPVIEMTATATSDPVVAMSKETADEKSDKANSSTDPSNLRMFNNGRSMQNNGVQRGNMLQWQTNSDNQRSLNRDQSYRYKFELGNTMQSGGVAGSGLGANADSKSKGKQVVAPESAGQASEGDVVRVIINVIE